MKISHNHPLAKRILQVGQQVTHNGMTYDVEEEYYDGYEVTPRSLCAWKKHNKLF